MPKFGGFSPGFINEEYFRALAPHLPIFGFTRMDWDKMGHYSEKVAGDVYYRPLPFEGEDNFLSFGDIQALPVGEQAKVWLKTCEKDGDSLQRIIGQANDRGKRPIIQLFNEPTEILDSAETARRYSQFSAHVADIVWNMGGMAAVYGGGTGWETRALISLLGEMLAVCDAYTPIACFEYHAYNPLHPKVWVGLNQSHGVNPNASEEWKLAALKRSPWQEPITTKEQLYPAWLGPRIWGIDNGDGTHGIPELYGKNLLLGEGVVDAIVDPRLPQQAGRPWWPNRNLLARELELHPEDTGAALLHAADDILDRLRAYGAPKKRIAFSLADGYHWQNHNLLYSPRSFEAYLAYLREPDLFPAPILLEGGSPPQPDLPPEPPQTPPDAGTADRLLLAYKTLEEGLSDLHSALAELLGEDLET